MHKKYGFAYKATYFVRLRLVRLKRLMRTSTALCVKRLIAYVYYMCSPSDLCIQVRPCVYSDLLHRCTVLRVNPLIHTRYGFARKETHYLTCFLTRWRGDDSVADARWFFNIAMTVDECYIILWPSWFFAPEDLSEDYDPLISSLRRSFVTIGPSLSSSLGGLLRYFFDLPCVGESDS